MGCTDCKEKAPQPVDFQTHQADMARMERSNQRMVKCLVFLCCVCLALGFFLYLAHVKAENALLENNQRWIDMWKEYDFESYEYQQDGTGVNIIGDRNGVKNYGTISPEAAQNP